MGVCDHCLVAGGAEAEDAHALPSPQDTEVVEVADSQGTGDDADAVSRVVSTRTHVTQSHSVEAAGLDPRGHMASSSITAHGFTEVLSDSPEPGDIRASADGYQSPTVISPGFGQEEGLPLRWEKFPGAPPEILPTFLSMFSPRNLAGKVKSLTRNISASPDREALDASPASSSRSLKRPKSPALRPTRSDSRNPILPPPRPRSSLSPTPNPLDNIEDSFSPRSVSLAHLPGISRSPQKGHSPTFLQKIRAPLPVPGSKSLTSLGSPFASPRASPLSSPLSGTRPGSPKAACGHLRANGAGGSLGPSPAVAGAASAFKGLISSREASQSPDRHGQGRVCPEEQFQGLLPNRSPTQTDFAAGLVPPHSPAGSGSLHVSPRLLQAVHALGESRTSARTRSQARLEESLMVDNLLLAPKSQILLGSPTSKEPMHPSDKFAETVLAITNIKKMTRLQHKESTKQMHTEEQLLRDAQMQQRRLRTENIGSVSALLMLYVVLMSSGRVVFNNVTPHVLFIVFEALTDLFLMLNIYRQVLWAHHHAMPCRAMPCQPIQAILLPHSGCSGTGFHKARRTMDIMELSKR